MKSRKLRKKTYKKKNKKTTYRGGMQQSQGEGISDLPVVKVDVIESWKLMMKRMMDLFESNFKNTMNFAKQINDKDARKQIADIAGETKNELNAALGAGKEKLLSINMNQIPVAGQIPAIANPGSPMAPMATGSPMAPMVPGLPMNPLMRRGGGGGKSTKKTRTRSKKKNKKTKKLI